MSVRSASARCRGPSRVGTRMLSRLTTFRVWDPNWFVTRMTRRLNGRGARIRDEVREPVLDLRLHGLALLLPRSPTLWHPKEKPHQQPQKPLNHAIPGDRGGTLGTPTHQKRSTMGSVAAAPGAVRDAGGAQERPTGA